MKKCLLIALIVFSFYWKTNSSDLRSYTLGRSSIDQTTNPDATGKDVVDACIQQVNTYSFKNDLNLLKRIALVESDFGRNQSVIQANRLGGIWQISSMIYHTIKADTSLPTLVNLSLYDFSAPLTSAYAARLYIKSTLNGTYIPGTTEDQAQWWSNYYHPGADPAVFIERVEEFDSANRCNVSKLDLWFVIDGSGSMGKTNFDTCLEFVNQTAAEFLISPDDVRTGLMIYAHYIHIKSYLNQDLNNKDFSNVVLSVRYSGGGTETGRAISEVYKYGFNVTNGMRPLTEGVPRVLVVLTDGQSSDSVIEPSNEVKDDGITVFAIGVGNSTDPDEIDEIASNGLAFELAKFTELVTFLKQVIGEESCKTSAVVPDNNEVSVEVQPEQTLFFEMSLITTGSIELFFSISSNQGSAVLYFSLAAKNPNSAFYDIRTDITTGDTTLMINTGSIGDNSIELATIIKSLSPKNSSSATTPLYLSLQSTGSETFDLGLKAIGSPFRFVPDPSTTTLFTTEPSSRVPDPSTTTLSTTEPSSTLRYTISLKFQLLFCFCSLVFIFLA